MDYEKLYKEAKQRAIDASIDGYLDAVAVEEIFQELKSEDERIREELIEYHRSMAAAMNGNRPCVHEAWISWLEKHSQENMIEALRLEYEKGKADALSEQRKEWTAEDLLNRNEIEDILQEYNRDDLINWLEKQGEHAELSQSEVTKISDQELEPKFKVGDTIRLKNSLAEFTIESISNGRYYVKGSSIDIIACDRDYELAVPNLANSAKTCKDEKEIRGNNGVISPKDLIEEQAKFHELFKDNAQLKQEWSEENKKIIIGNIRHIISEYDKITKKANEPCWYIGDCLLWLQDIETEGLPQSKQDWSEEDEFCMNTILNILEQIKVQSTYGEDDTAEKCINFLKSKLKK